MSLKSNLVFKTTMWMLGYIYLRRKYFLRSMKDSLALIHLLHDKSNNQSPKAKIDKELHFPPKALESLQSITLQDKVWRGYLSNQEIWYGTLNPLSVVTNGINPKESP